MCHLKDARAGLDRAGEGASIVTEELGLDQVLWGRTAVEDDERAIASL